MSDLPGRLQMRELDLDRREQALSTEERALDSRWDAHERRWRLLEELRNYLREREATLRDRAARLGVGQGDVEDALAPPLGESMDADTMHDGVNLERSALADQRDALCARREAALASRRELLGRAERVHTTLEETLVLREQQLADAFRRLVRIAGGGASQESSPELAEGAARRRSRRIEVHARVDYGTPHNFYAAETANIGVGGLFIATENLLQVGRAIALNLDLPESGTLSLKGEVAWRRPSPSGEGPAGLGIKFVELQEEMRDAIEQFLEKRAPESAIE